MFWIKLLTLVAFSAATDVYQEIRAKVGPASSAWVGSTWIPTPGGRLWTPLEIAAVFSQHCTLFMGDSLQRRARDTLYYMTLESSKNDTEPNNVKVADFPRNKFLGRDSESDVYTQRNLSDSSCLDMDWQPHLKDIDQAVDDFYNNTLHNIRFQHYDQIVVGATVWDAEGRAGKVSAAELRRKVNRTLHNLNTLGLPVYFKTSGWCQSCPWTPNEHIKGRRDNYLIWAANDQAIQTAESLENVHIIDWGREVLGRSIGQDRIASSDNAPNYHYGLEPRLQFVQMLVTAVSQRTTTKPHTAIPPPPATIRTGAEVQAASLVLVFAILWWERNRHRRGGNQRSVDYVSTDGGRTNETKGVDR